MTDESPYLVYVHTGIWPSPSPSTVFVTGTAWGLAPHCPSVFIVRNGSSESTDHVFNTITGRKLPGNIIFKRIGYGGSIPGHTSFFLEAVRTIGNLVRQNRVKAVMTRNIGFLPYLAYIRTRYHIPCLFETHDFFGDLTFRTDLKRSLKNMKRSQFEKRFLPRLDGLVCLTEPQRDIFRQQYPALPSIVAPTGLFSVAHNAVKRENSLCYIGSLDPHKGLGIVLDALARTSDPTLKLLIIGGKTDHERQSFMQFAHLIGVADRIHISTWLHHADIGHLIDRCVAGLVPLRDTPFNRAITSPLKILDYFSRCVPVIASDLPSVRAYVKPGIHGLLFEPDNPESLAETIESCLTANRLSKFAAHIERDAPHLRWTVRGKLISDFVQSLR